MILVISTLSHSTISGDRLNMDALNQPTSTSHMFAYANVVTSDRRDCFVQSRGVKCVVIRTAIWIWFFLRSEYWWFFVILTAIWNWFCDLNMGFRPFACPARPTSSISGGSKRRCRGTLQRCGRVLRPSRPRRGSFPERCEGHACRVHC